MAGSGDPDQTVQVSNHVLHKLGFSATVRVAGKELIQP